MTNPRRDVDETAPPLTSPVEQIVSTTNPPVTVDSTRADATTTTGAYLRHGGTDCAGAYSDHSGDWRLHRNIDEPYSLNFDNRR